MSLVDFELGAAQPRLRPRSAVEIASSFRIGERYASHHDPTTSTGRDFGFVVRIDCESRWRAPEDVVAFSPAGLADARLFQLRALHAQRADGVWLGGAALDAALDAFVATHADRDREDAIAQARLAIHRDFDKPLYIRHFAEIAGVHEATFARRFASRYGTTPTRYRMVLRLAEAALLLATRPGLTVREIAARVGFEDVPYFHRAFAAQFGVTPLALGRMLGA